jgi:hypothetical protein
MLLLLQAARRLPPYSPPAARFVGQGSYRDAIMHKPNLPPIAIHPVIATALAVGLASAKPWSAETASFAEKTLSRSAQS